MISQVRTSTGRAAASVAVAVVVLAGAPAAGAQVTAETRGAAHVAAAASTTTATAPVLRRGDRGSAVLAAQERLASLGYWLGTPDGSFGPLTEQAVFALQGAAGLTRDGVLGPLTRRALDSGTRPTASTRTGHAVEIVRKAGLLLVVDDGTVSRILHTSTGTFQYYWSGGVRRLADTPAGTFRVTRAVNAWEDAPLGRLYRPRYFHPDGIAVHGSTSIPAYPASQGARA